ncbi:3-oxo-5-alpha-steroid 4-dehydrogenase 2-like [Gadus macrocephalus]|uniref:3-oxo-5-alpha-steroid 4-dehydrogenase 2-like n=1 Tax=Gadus macrocephalus TaxID=80720 RepID=UPI0028CB782D|nr:3-oxo-5-alpha-steroid 4-dehydrogenase 2-like [Gadus macrocephalus]
MECRENLVQWLCWSLLLGGPLVCWVLLNTERRTLYGRYTRSEDRCLVNTKLVWMIQEVPSLLVPLLLLLSTESRAGVGRSLLLGTFCLHYFHRSFIYAWRTRGRPFPVHIAVKSFIFCGMNGLLQGHYQLHCAPSWQNPVRMAVGLLLFFAGLIINIHSDHLLRSLRKPGEVHYRIPRGGMFEFVSGANYFGEILEWFGYAVAVWSLPAAAFFLFTSCTIGPRAIHHHRFYQQQFKDYPQSRRALIPFLL